MINQHVILQEIDMLDNSIEKVLEELEKLKCNLEYPAMLHVIRHGNGFQYYRRRNKSETNGEDIRKTDIRKAITLAQIEYDERLLDALQKAKHTLKKCKATGIINPFEIAMEGMSPGKKELINPHYISDESYIHNWKQQKMEGLMFKDGSPGFYTRSGLRVRSKSEVLIADMLDELSVPFFYEKPLRFKKRTVHPDFTLLKIRERKEVYWEHFGMMDDREYKDAAVCKMREYEENGYYQFDSVIWTFESLKCPMNTREIRNMVKSLLVSLGYET